MPVCTGNMKYSPLDNKSDQDSPPSEDDEAQDSLLSRSQTPGKESILKKLLVLCAIISTVFSVSVFALGVWIGRLSVSPKDICPSHVQKYSTILEEVDTSIQSIRFNGSFMKLKPFRLDAGPEVDAAWKSLGSDYKVVIVPPEEAIKANLVKPAQVRVAEKHGGGYPANVEVLHQIHCLNLLRKATWYNYEYYAEKREGPFLNEERILKFHVTHCLDTLRQQLMCQPDTAFLGQIFFGGYRPRYFHVFKEKLADSESLKIWWDKKAPKAFIDFDNEHKCKNFEAIRQWAEDHQLPYLLEDNVPVDFLEAPDINVVYDAIP